MSGPAALTLHLLLAAGAARGDGVRCPVEGGVVFADPRPGLVNAELRAQAEGMVSLLSRFVFQSE